MPLTVATWNVNSIKARIEAVCRWLDRDDAPEIILLQELKCVSEAVPTDRLEALGYTVFAHGQKTYNGVAILSRKALSDTVTGLPGAPDDDQARWQEATIDGCRIVNLYLPNGNPVGAADDGDPSEKYRYKLAWIDRMAARLADLLAEPAPLIVGGDFNLIPAAVDCHDPAAWEGDALFRPESRAAFRRLLNLGLTDAFRAVHPRQSGAYSFWDYQGGAWPRDKGIRIDHFLLGPEAADRLTDCWIDRDPRGWEKASDHTPVVARFG